MKLMLLALALISGQALAEAFGIDYEARAKAGDSAAQYYLAEALFGQRDYAGAEHWARRAADQGQADGWAVLAELKMLSEDTNGYTQARTLAETAVARGSEKGKVVLGKILANRLSGATDYPTALKLLKEAASDTENDAAVDAQLSLGMMYAAGVGTPQDPQLALHYLRRASALSRTGYAEYWTGIHFLNGIKGFLSPDKPRAIGWFKESCAQGFDSACDELDSLALVKQ